MKTLFKIYIYTFSFTVECYRTVFTGKFNANNIRRGYTGSAGEQPNNVGDG